MRALNRAMVELVEEYGAVRFETLAVEDKASMMRLVRVLDQAVSYISSSRTMDDPLAGEDSSDLLASMPTLEDLGDIDDVQERWGSSAMSPLPLREGDGSGDTMEEDADLEDTPGGGRQRRAMEYDEPAATVFHRPDHV